MGRFQKLLNRFFPLRGRPYPLTENHFAKKTLAERGGTPPLTENPKKNSKTMGQKGLKLAFAGQK